jgi:predicted nuclease with TOPRIM domain
MSQRFALSFLALTLLLVQGCGQELQKENEALKAQVQTVQDENAALQEKLQSLEGEKQTLSTNIETLEQQVADLSQALEAAKKPGAIPKRKPAQ